MDEVERITGYDFFPALPDEIENEVESHASIDDWRWQTINRYEVGQEQFSSGIVGAILGAYSSFQMRQITKRKCAKQPNENADRDMINIEGAVRGNVGHTNQSPS